MTKNKVEVKPGDWVLLEGDKVIYSDRNFGKVHARAERMKGRDVIISKEPPTKMCFY